MEMICVTDIKITMCNEEKLWAYHTKTPCNYDKELSPEVATELIRGQRFINKNGKIVCIGIKKDLQEMIGLPFAAFEEMEARIERLNTNEFYLKKRINNLETIFKEFNFWERLKYLFLGRKIKILKK